MSVKHIFFEGPNKSGKTTLRKAFAKQTNEKYVTVDRGVISNLVYDIVFKRIRYSFWDYFEAINKLTFDGAYFVILIPSIDDLEKRNNEDDAEFIKQEYFLFEMIGYFLSKVNDNVILLDTSEFDVETCVRLITDNLAYDGVT